MRKTVRLTRRPDGGFRVDGVAATPIEGVPDDDGFAVTGAGSWRLVWNATERGWLLHRLVGGQREEAGQTTASAPLPLAAPVSVLLEDGRLFRLAALGLSDPTVELGRWDVPGAYVVGHPVAGAWELERTAAGTALEAPPELWILTCVALGQLDGWY